MNIDTIKAEILRKISDNAFDINTENELKSLLQDINISANRGRNTYYYVVSTHYKNYDIDYIVKTLKQKGFKLTLDRDFIFFGKIQKIKIKW